MQWKWGEFPRPWELGIRDGSSELLMLLEKCRAADLIEIAQDKGWWELGWDVTGLVVSV